MNFIENESAQKLRGGYYTPPDVAAFLARWALGTGPARVLEPSCGDGAFLRVLAALAPERVAQVHACERDPAEAAKAQQAAGPLPLALHTGDFLAWAEAATEQDVEFDAILGNPPFIRYQYLEAALQDRAARLFARHGLRFTRHTNAWVPFVVASLALLRPGGRLGMVVPAELLHVLHAQSLRDHLLGACARVTVLDPAELYFEGALQGVVLLMLEKRDRPGGAGGLAVQTVRGRGLLAGCPTALVDGLARTDARRLQGQKWMAALLTAEERALLDRLGAHPAVHPLGAVAAVSVGIVTGANRFFLVTEETARAHGLQPHCQPMFGRSEHVPGVVYDAAVHAANAAAGRPTCFVDLRGIDPADLAPGPRAYVAAGEAAGLHRRYKCRIRTPWYAVPSVSSAPVAMLKRCHDHPRLVHNQLGALTTDTAYRIVPRAPHDAARLVGAFVNSLTALGAELAGRHYGGGVLELVPSEIRGLPLPLAPGAPPRRDRLDAMMRDNTPAEAIFAEQDPALLGPLGLGAAELATLQGAWARLRDRRQRRPA